MQTKTNIDPLDEALSRILTKNSNQADDKLVSKAILDQILAGWPYLLRMKGVCYQIGSLLMDIGRNNQNKNESEG